MIWLEYSSSGSVQIKKQTLMVSINDVIYGLYGRKHGKVCVLSVLCLLNSGLLEPFIGYWFCTGWITAKIHSVRQGYFFTVSIISFAVQKLFNFMQWCFLKCEESYSENHWLRLDLKVFSLCCLLVTWNYRCYSEIFGPFEFFIQWKRWLSSSSSLQILPSFSRTTH